MKRIFGSWNKYEILWLCSFCGIAAVITAVSGDSPFGFTVFLSGVLCVIFAAKGNILNYAVGMYNTFGYAFLAYQNGLYGEMGLNQQRILWGAHVQSTRRTRPQGGRGAGGGSSFRYHGARQFVELPGIR